MAPPMNEGKGAPTSYIASGAFSGATTGTTLDATTAATPDATLGTISTFDLGETLIATPGTMTEVY